MSISAEHAVDRRRVGALAATCVEHARRELLLTVGARRVAHHAFVVGELLFKQHWIAPVEASANVRGHRWPAGQSMLHCQSRP
jgi:hypothetical protein